MAFKAAYTESKVQNMQNYVEERDGGYYIRYSHFARQHSSCVPGRRVAGRDSPLVSDGRPSVRINGAITFYLENKEKVEEYLRAQERRWDALRTERPKPDDALTNRLREAKEHAALTRS